MRATTINLDFPVGYEDLFRPARYKVVYGGRGSSKSWSFARALVILATQRRLRVLCCRELQNSISESVHRLLSDQIALMGLARYYEIQQQGIYGANGSMFTFSGIKTNPSKIKSTEGVDVAWVEEGEKVSNASWETLIPTVRGPSSEIWVSMNVDLEDDPAYRRFVVSPPPDSVVRQFNWSKNPWFPAALRREKDYLYRVDPEAAACVWGGQPRHNSSSQIFAGKYTIEAFTAPNDNDGSGSALHWDGPYFGCDWGFSQDPTVGIKLWIDDNKCDKGRRLMVEHEVWGIGVELDDTAAMFNRIPGAGARFWRADSSRPETINHVKNKSSLQIEPAAKWKGSVEDGISWLRSFNAIVIHPRCQHTAQEARLYSYKVDRLTRDVLAEVRDRNNHCWDAIRYACEPMIFGATNLGIWSNL